MGIDVGGIAGGLVLVALLVGWGLAVGRNRAAQEARQCARAARRAQDPDGWWKRALWDWLIFG